MQMPNQFISIDWGTSRFRARLVNTQALEVQNTIETSNGIKQVYEAFQTQNELSRKDFFGVRLLELISPIDPTEIPIVASGMISSSIGMKELPYADFALSGKGRNLKYEHFKLQSQRDLIIVSGAKDSHGFMRGEESQAVGLSHLLDNNQKCILILAGTHSKHLTYQEGKFTRMKNFMTGELFRILSNTSILQYSVSPSSFDKKHKTIFLEGVKIGIEENLTASLLAVRYRDLIDTVDHNENYFYLSGLLIGNEISYLRENRLPIYIGATNQLTELYQIALASLDPNAKVHPISKVDYDNSCIVTHSYIVENYLGHGV